MPDNTTDPMPVFVLKAKDNLAPTTIEEYQQYCLNVGLDDQAEQVALALEEVMAWRARHPDECEYPDHAHVPVNPVAARGLFASYCPHCFTGDPGDDDYCGGCGEPLT